MSAEEISTRLRRARQEAGLTQEQLAEKILVSRVTISHWENGKSLPDIASLLSLSDLYQISLDELLKGDPKMREKVVKDAKNLELLRRMIGVILGGTLIIAGIYIVSLILGGAFLDFWQAAMPYLLIGICLAAFFAYEGQKHGTGAEGGAAGRTGAGTEVGTGAEAEAGAGDRAAAGAGDAAKASAGDGTKRTANPSAGKR